MLQAPGLLRKEVSDPFMGPELGDHLTAICESEAFKNSSTLKNLLCYLFLHRDKQLSEYVLAVEALGRRVDFDPQVDATVRVQISRLRRRLKDFYLSEGRSLPLRFCIPMGTHQLVLEETQAGGPSSAASDAANIVALTAPPLVPDLDWRQRARVPSAVTLLVCLSLLLAVTCIWQLFKIKAQQRALAQQAVPGALLPLWQEFSATGKPVEIVIPNPTFFAWLIGQNETLMGRDTTVNSFMDRDGAAELRMLNEKYGRPTLSQYYAVSSDVVASLKLLHYMDAGALRADIAISSEAPSEVLENQNIIFVGTPGTLTPFKSQLDRLYFRFDPQGYVIQNPKPRAGERSTFSSVAESPVNSLRPGLIAVLPGFSKDSRIMIVAGQSTAALISFLTSKNGSDQLQRMRQQSGGGPYFEAVILSELSGDTVLSNRLVALRTYSAVWSHN